MVDTIKFSEFASGGDLSPNDITVGLDSTGTVNTRFENALPMLPPGTTGDRPAVDPSMYYRLRFNTTDEAYEFYNPTLAAWETVETSGGPSNILALLASHTAGEGASLIGLENQGTVVDKTVQDLANANLIAQSSNGSLANGQFLNVLSSGIVKNTTGTGVLSILTGSASIDEVINDDTMATATADNIPTALSVFNFVNNKITPVYPVTATLTAATTTADLSNVIYNNGVSGVGATITNVANGAISIDGVALNLNDTVLVKDGEFTIRYCPGINGIYTVTTVGDGSNPFVLTRDTSYDTPADFIVGNVFAITSGTQNAGTEWVLTNAPTVIDEQYNEASYVSYEENTPSEVSGFVDLIGNENVYGIKNFQDPVVANVVSFTEGFIVDPASDIQDPPGGYGYISLTFSNPSLTAVGSSWIINADDGIDFSAATQNITFTTDANSICYFDSKIAVGEATDAEIIVGGTTYNFDVGAGANTTPTTYNFLASRHTDTANLPSSVVQARSRGSYSAPTIVQDNDELGSFIFLGHDGVDYAQAARIDAIVDGTPGSNDMPGRLVFSTTPNGSQTPVARMTIFEDGNFDFGLTDGQFFIGNTGNPANKTTLTAGSGININNTPGNVEISVTTTTTGDSLQLSMLLMGG